MKHYRKPIKKLRRNGTSSFRAPENVEPAGRGRNYMKENGIDEDEDVMEGLLAVDRITALMQGRAPPGHNSDSRRNVYDAGDFAEDLIRVGVGGRAAQDKAAGGEPRSDRKQRARTAIGGAAADRAAQAFRVLCQHEGDIEAPRGARKNPSAKEAAASLARQARNCLDSGDLQRAKDLLEQAYPLIDRAYPAKWAADLLTSTAYTRAVLKRLGVHVSRPTPAEGWKSASQNNPKRNPSDLIKSIKALVPRGYSVRTGTGSNRGSVIVQRPAEFNHLEWARVSRLLRQRFPDVDFGHTLAPEEFCRYWLDLNNVQRAAARRSA